ncbi:MAG: YbjP/YqhG family protein [Verrucomicrobiota bacterium]|nr:YbjP/YqhG family protein [Verrucomicrobiota bacterium]
MNFRCDLFAVILLSATAICLGARPPSTGPDPDAILKSLYKTHDAQKGPFFNKEDRGALEQYFTKELSSLIIKDAIASKGEVGALEFDPLYESQDPQITKFKIGEVHWGGIVKHVGDEREDGLAVVEVSFRDSGKPHAITFRFHQNAKKAWKIADINYSDGRSIVGILRGDGLGPNGGNAAPPEP